MAVSAEALKLLNCPQTEFPVLVQGIKIAEYSRVVYWSDPSGIDQRAFWFADSEPQTYSFLDNKPRSYTLTVIDSSQKDSGEKVIPREPTDQELTLFVLLANENNAGHPLVKELTRYGKNLLEERKKQMQQFVQEIDQL